MTWLTNVRTNTQNLINELFNEMVNGATEKEIKDAYNTLDAVNQVVYLFAAGYTKSANEALNELDYVTKFKLQTALMADGFKVFCKVNV